MREFVNLAFAEIGVDIRWQGQGVDEKGIDKKTNKVLIEIDPNYFRPTEVDTLLGDPTKAREKLGWVARTSLQDLVAEMVREDLKDAERDDLCRREGFPVLTRHEQ